MARRKGVTVSVGLRSRGSGTILNVGSVPTQEAPNQLSGIRRHRREKLRADGLETTPPQIAEYSQSGEPPEETVTYVITLAAPHTLGGTVSLDEPIREGLQMRTHLPRCTSSRDRQIRPSCSLISRMPSTNIPELGTFWRRGRSSHTKTTMRHAPGRRRREGRDRRRALDGLRRSRDIRAEKATPCSIGSGILTLIKPAPTNAFLGGIRWSGTEEDGARCSYPCLGRARGRTARRRSSGRRT